MNRVTIELSECKGCRLCVETCPYGCLSIGSDINTLGYQYARFDSGECNACGLCFYICPEPGAITVFREQDGHRAHAAASADATASAGAPMSAGANR